MPPISRRISYSNPGSSGSQNDRNCALQRHTDRSTCSTLRVPSISANGAAPCSTTATLDSEISADRDKSARDNSARDKSPRDKSADHTSPRTNSARCKSALTEDPRSKAMEQVLHHVNGAPTLQYHKRLFDDDRPRSQSTSVGDFELLERPKRQGPSADWRRSFGSFEVVERDESEWVMSVSSGRKRGPGRERAATRRVRGTERNHESVFGTFRLG